MLSFACRTSIARKRLKRAGRAVLVTGLTFLILIGCTEDTPPSQSWSTVWTWGGNSFGQIGDGTIDYVAHRAFKQSMTDVRAVSAGFTQTMALLGDGTVWLWGSLIVETPTGEGCPNSTGPYYCWLRPTKVQLPTKAASIESGSLAVYAILADGEGHLCRWGQDRPGHFASGPSGPTTSPTPLCPDQTNTQFAKPDHLFDVSDYEQTLALQSGPPELKVWAWGRNDTAQLAQPASVASSDTPLAVAGLPNNIVQVAAGVQFSLALTAEGQVWGWGRAADCQLGTELSVPASGNIETPTKILSATAISEIDAGISHVVALRRDGKVVTWGSNRDGQLGYEVTICGGHAHEVPGLTDVVDVAAGGSFSLALKSDGSVWAWGDNRIGQLGANSTDSCRGACSKKPIRVEGITDAKRIDAGAGHAVAIGP